MQVPRARTNPVDGVPDLKLKEIRLGGGTGVSKYPTTQFV